MNCVRYLFGIITLIFFSTTGGYGQTSLEGKVTDEVTNEPIIFCTLVLYKNGVLKTGAETDLDGNYFFSDIEPGTYDVEARYVGYTTQRQTRVIINAGRTHRLDFTLSQGVVVDEVTITEYKAPLIEIDNTTSGGTVTAEKIRTLPTKNINKLAATTAGLASIDGGAINVRGSRSNATDYYIDGIRVSGLIPESEIEQLQVLTGGLPAQFGDVTGGVISITSKGPSSILSGGLEMETSQYLDAFGYNQIRANLSGPLFKKSSGESILGFRVSGQYLNREDDFPSALGVYRLDAESIGKLEEEPFRIVNGTAFPTGEFLNTEQIGNPLSARPNEQQKDIDLTAKLDARINDQIDVSVSGSYDNSIDRFTPSSTWALLNWQNNPYTYRNGYRGNFRFRQKFGTPSFRRNSSDQERINNNSVIRNASYTIQVGYEKRFGRTEDFRHEDNLFNYGYLGSVDRSWLADADIVSDTSQWGGQLVYDILGRPWAHLGYAQRDEEFTANDEINGVLSKYNSINGSFISPLNILWSGLYSNVGQVYNSFSKSETDRYTINISSGFDFLPGGSEKGRHSIQFGFAYEQRTVRSYAIAPVGLWTLARLNANRHIIGVDTDEVIGTFEEPIPGGIGQFDQYRTLISPENNLLFYQKVRELTGQSIYDYVNVDALDPNDLRLDMFSAGELNDFGVVSYLGYDHLGNKLSGDLNFTDFFSSVDDEDRRTFLVAPNKPIYGAAYIQDKFSYKDIIFRLGLRVDYFDANTKVLKDPYSLYEIETAEEFFARTGQDQPDAIANDYRVYISNPESTNIVGFRRGDQWFLPNGTSISDGSRIFGGGVVTPALKARAQGLEPNIQNRDFDPNTSFEDYTPQINFMPRLAFSFPISKEAGFFAHYDILVQRPPSNTIATALNYFYFSDPSRTPSNNPALKPEKTIDYEVGFQQKISNSSAIKLSAYYKELRDMIQSRTLTNTFPVTRYETFDNLDFGTVKGFSFSYDLRRTGNLELQANYTLQFADGSGSNALSSRGINSRGALRTLFPLSFDERHRLNAIVDYRYAGGSRYNGPRIGGADILANAGFNLQLTAVSGRPYTQRRTVSPFGGSGFVGGINEARLPWNFTIDVRADKNITLGTPGKGKALNLNVYVRVQNLLNAKNVIGVYPVTGDPDDDGFLLSSFGEDRQNQVLENGQNVDNFLAAYGWRLLNQGNYTLPRRIFLGAIVEF